MTKNTRDFEETYAEFHMKMVAVLGSIELFKSRIIEIIQCVDLEVKRSEDFECAYMTFENVKSTFDKFIDNIVEDSDEKSENSEK